MPNAIRILTLAALALVAVQPTLAQEGLLEIYQRALQNDPQIRREEALYLSTLEIRAMARSAVIPNLRLGAGTTGSFSENPYGATTGAGQVFGGRQRIRKRREFVEHEPVADDLRLGPDQAARTGRPADRPRRSDLRSRQAESARAYGRFLLRCPRRRGDSGVGNPESRGDRPPARAGPAALRGRADRDHRSRAGAGQLRPRGCQHDPGRARIVDHLRSAARTHRRIHHEPRRPHRRAASAHARPRKRRGMGADGAQAEPDAHLEPTRRGYRRKQHRGPARLAVTDGQPFRGLQRRLDRQYGYALLRGRNDGEQVFPCRTTTRARAQATTGRST